MKYLILVCLSLATLGFAQNENTNVAAPNVTIRNAFQGVFQGQMMKEEVDVEVVTLAFADDVIHDGIIFDITITQESISMVYNVSDRASLDPTGAIGEDIFERYYFSFDGYKIVSAKADQAATSIPSVELINEELLIEFSEGMELGVGKDATIILELRPSN